MPSANGKTKLNIDIPLELKQQLKVHCVLNKLNMTHIVENLIRSYLDNQIGKEVG